MRAQLVEMGRPNSDPQRRYFASRAKYVCYGGARGGGKTWCTQRKAAGGCLRYPGIRILIVRRRFEDLDGSIISPILELLEPVKASYNASKHLFRCINGSTIRFGNMESPKHATQGKYQGQEYDWIFLEEATQFTEAEFRGIAACCRGVSNIPRRIFMTANPGDIGHQWVKRLFVERDFLPNEQPEDYEFIKATVDDNVDLMKSSPDYVNALDLLPEDIRQAHRFGDWDALAGGYFPEFRVSTHVYEAFKIPDGWKRYRVFDYGLDMFACLWIAVDYDGRCYVYRELAEKNLIVSAAARAMLRLTNPDEHIEYTIAPPDMWSTMKDTGKTMAQAFINRGLDLVRANNSRVQGWMAVKELLKVMPDGKPGLMISHLCKGLIDDLMAIQHDEKNPSDCAKDPHEITHRPDALRYFCQLWTEVPELPQEDAEDIDRRLISYEELMAGGDADDSYLGYQG